MACAFEPKFEKEIIAIRGSMSKRRTASAVSSAISASSSAVGSMLTVVSAKKKVWSFSIRM